MNPQPDHLRIWLAVRETAPWHTARAPDIVGDRPVAPVRDGAVHDIDTFDRARSPQRADRLRAALTRARGDAAAGSPLTFRALSTWQRLVLGVERAPFRARPAVAKAGREHYGTGPDLRDRLDACLAESGDPTLPVSARAARAYLDVCYFHPFDDGNARSAFLALTFVLERTGIALDQVGPIRRLRRYADDPDEAVALADLVAALITTSQRRGARD